MGAIDVDEVTTIRNSVKPIKYEDDAGDVEESVYGWYLLQENKNGVQRCFWICYYWMDKYWVIQREGGLNKALKFYENCVTGKITFNDVQEIERLVSDAKGHIKEGDTEGDL